MGHKYSTVYQHNTNANYHTYNHHTNDTNIEDINDIVKQIGQSNCKLFDSYSGHVRCKLCYISLHQEPVIMLNCDNLNHRYHQLCMSLFIKYADNRETFKCNGCRNLLSKYIIQIGNKQHNQRNQRDQHDLKSNEDDIVTIAD